MSQAIERYASTLFELASEDNQIANIEKDANVLVSAFDESEELRAAMKSPLYPSNEKAAALLEVGKQLGISQLVTNFLQVVVNNSRAGELPEILKAFVELCANARGAVKAQVTSAQQLTDAQITDLKANLSSAFNAEVQVETSVNPDLIGGLVVKVGSRLFDDSIKTKLDGLKNSLKGA